VAIALLSKLGHDVVAVSGKPQKEAFLKSLGAQSIISREEASDGGGKRPMLKERWAGVVDTVGGDILAAALKSLRYGASAAICGMVQSADLPTSVFPFILRDISLLGVDSVELPLATKSAMWDRLAGDWKLAELDSLATEIELDGLPDALDAILAGKLAGRTLVKVS
jgi:alcohol dehydrogenase